MNNKEIFLVDGNYFMHRIMHAGSFSTLSFNSRFTGGVYGFLKSLLTIDLGILPDKIIVVWDYGRSDRRMKLYPDYKAGRVHDNTVTEELGMTYYEAFTYSKEELWKILPMMGILNITIEGKEADDVISKIAHFNRFNDINFWMITDDSDYLTMISPNVSVYRPIAKQYIPLSLFEERTEFKTPLQYLYAKCMTGDGSDAIWGIPGIGGGTAYKLTADLPFTDEIENDLKLIIDRANDKGGRLSKFNNFYEEEDAYGYQIFLRNVALIDTRYEKFDDEELSMIDKVVNNVRLDKLSDQKLCEVFSVYGMRSLMDNIMYYTKLISKL